MKTIKNVFGVIGISALIFFSACESMDQAVTNVRLPDTKPKIVVASYISPQDTIISTIVTLSDPIYDKQSINGVQYLSNATVIISDFASFKQMVYNHTKREFFINASDFPIVGGKSYKLTVTDSDGKKVESVCSVPINFNNNIELIKIDSTNGHNVYFQFQDTKGSNDFYRTMVFGYYKDPYSTILVKRLLYPNNMSEFCTDKNRDGELIKFSASFDPYYLKYFEVHLLSTDETYYNYHRSLENYNSDIIFGEPTFVYSNVTGGLGVFAGYNATKKTFIYK